MRIRYLREKHHYTREALSEMANISPKFLYEIENGQKGFSAMTLYNLSIALDTDADYILFGTCNEEKISDETRKVLSLFDANQKQSLFLLLEAISKLVNDKKY